jgi:hypothetical protein
LHKILENIRERLAADRLHLHPRKAHIYHTARGIDLFGYQVFPHKRKLRNDNGHAFHRRLRKMAQLYHEGRLDLKDIHPRVRSRIGHAIHGETEGLRKKTVRVYNLSARVMPSLSVYCAAGRGTMNRRTCARPTVTGTRRITATTISVFGSPVRPPAVKVSLD